MVKKSIKQLSSLGYFGSKLTASLQYSNFLLAAIVMIFLVSGCEEVSVPKQIGYHKIDLPAHEYQDIPLEKIGEKPYTFQYSKAAIIKNDSSKFSEPHWVDIRYPMFDADVQITYKAVGGDKQKLSQYIEDVRKLTQHHNIKAYSIGEEFIKNKSGNGAFIFLLTGQVPTQFQFYTTDSSKHFLRGALYFKTATKNDSLQPVIDYISEDMVHLLKTLEWRDLSKDKK